MTGLKKASVFALVLLMAGSMVFAQGASDASSAKTELNVLYYIDMSAPNSADEISAVWDVFEAQNPDIKVVREDLFNEPYHQKVEAYAASGNMPDVLYMWPGGRSAAVQNNHLVKDLAPFLKADGIYDDYAAAALVPQAAGYLAELPNGITSSHMMFVNDKLLESYGLNRPETLDDLLAMVPVLKSNGIDVIGMDNMSDWVMQSCLFSLVVGRLGGPDWYEQLAAGKINFTDPWFVNSLAVIDQLYATGALNRNTLNSAYGNGRGAFAAGKCAFFIDGDWACGNFQTDASTGVALISPQAQQDSFGMMVFPAIPGELVHNSTSGVVGTGFGMSANIEAGSAKEEAAWRLIKFLQSKYVQEWRLKTGASFPSNLTVDIAKVIADNNLEPFVQKRAEFYTKYSTTPVIDGVLDPSVYNVINVGLQEIGLGKKTPTQVAADVQKAWVAFNKN